MPNIFKMLCLVAIALLTGCAATTKELQRFAWVTGLKPEKAEYYRQLHANVWPSVNKMIKKCHIQNYSIYERNIEGKPYLFNCLEYTGTNFDADMKKMAADLETVRWWKETGPCSAPLPDADPGGRLWLNTKELYHLR
jgi:L-rhamnose mutarotase